MSYRVHFSKKVPTSRKSYTTFNTVHKSSFKGRDMIGLCYDRSGLFSYTNRSERILHIT